MKQLLCSILLVAGLTACNGAGDTQHTTATDTLPPSVVVPDSDSGKYKMPVEKGDTAKDQQMPVAMPDPGVEPK